MRPGNLFASGKQLLPGDHRGSWPIPAQHHPGPVGALWGYGTREELSAAGATLFCERPEMLSEVLSSNVAFCRPLPIGPMNEGIMDRGEACKCLA